MRHTTRSSLEVAIPKRPLHIIVAAARPLTLREMALALTIRENHQSYNDLDLKSQDWFRENIRNVWLFVTIIGSRICLLHQTAKEFLIQNDQEIRHESPHGGLKWKHSLQPQDSHRILTEIRTRYRLFAEFAANPNDTMLSRYVASHVFLGYPAKHWTTHLHASGIEVDTIHAEIM